MRAFGNSVEGARRQWHAGAAALIAFALLAGSAPAWAQEEATVKADIQAVLDRGAKALEAKDVDAYAKDLAADYSTTDLFGETSQRDKAVSTAKEMLGQAENVKQSYAIEHLTVKGDQATALVRTKGSADVKGPDGNMHKVQWDGREVQAWTKTADGWRQQASMDLTQTITMDDKPWMPETKEEEADLRKAIQSSYNAMAEAGQKGDWEAFSKQFPDDFAYVGPSSGSRQTRDQFLTDMKKEFATPPSSVAITVNRAMVKGDNAIVISTLRTEQERDTPEGKKKVVSTWVQRDTWKKTDAGWRPAEIRPLFREWSMDGKDQTPVYAVPAAKQP